VSLFQILILSSNIVKLITREELGNNCTFFMLHIEIHPEIIR